MLTSDIEVCCIAKYFFQSSIDYNSYPRESRCTTADVVGIWWSFSIYILLSNL